MPEIKTRDALKGTIKAIDKSAVAAERMKEAFVRTKKEAQHSSSPAENSPEEFAADQVTGTTEAIAIGTAKTFEKHGRNAVRESKANIEGAKNYLEHKKAERPKEAAKKAAAEKAKEAVFETHQTSQSVSSPYSNNTSVALDFSSEKSSQPMMAGTKVKTWDHSTGAIRTRESSFEPFKQVERIEKSRSIKGNSRTLKTPERPSKATIKSGLQADKKAQIITRSAIKTSESATKAVHIRARTVSNAAKRAAETSKRAVLAIIEMAKALIRAIIAGGWIAVTIILIVVLMGVALSLFGGGDGRASYQPVSAEVEAYTPIIRLYAQRYGVGEYVELIKAIMMQESCGQGLDPLQASESGYNTRYPHTPNAITDPEYSIDVGVQTIADSLRQAEVESPLDMDNIKLALQGYNYGNGFISWARANYGGYTPIAAIEFSDMMAARMGWAGYGDKQYAAHVLRYYPFGHAFAAGNNHAIVEVALTQLGNEGGEPYWSWWGLNYRVEWCAMFVSWCAEQCGYLDAGVLPKMEGVIPYAEWFRERDQWQDRSFEPMAGDIVFFDWQNDGMPDHVGIVEKCEGGFVYTIEGNSADRCAQNRYDVNDSSIFGYGLPEY